jgi:hypothetical protein
MTKKELKSIKRKAIKLKPIRWKACIKINNKIIPMKESKEYEYIEYDNENTIEMNDESREKPNHIDNKDGISTKGIAKNE